PTLFRSRHPGGPRLPDGRPPPRCRPLRDRRRSAPQRRLIGLGSGSRRGLGLCGGVEGATHQGEIFAHLVEDPGPAPQGGGGVEGGDEGGAQPPGVGGAPEPGDAGGGVQEQLGGEVAQRHHHPGPDEPDLLAQVSLAGVDLVGLGVAVAGGPALEDVGDVDGLPGDPDFGEEPVEQLARRPHERLALEVLVPPRRLPHEHQRGVGPPDPEDDVGASLRQPAGGTGLGLAAQRVEFDHRVKSPVVAVRSPAQPGNYSTDDRMAASIARPVASQPASATTSASASTEPHETANTASPSWLVCAGRTHTAMASWPRTARRRRRCLGRATSVATSTSVVCSSGDPTAAGGPGTAEPPVSGSPSSVNTSPTELTTAKAPTLKPSPETRAEPRPPGRDASKPRHPATRVP